MDGPLDPRETPAADAPQAAPGGLADLLRPALDLPSSPSDMEYRLSVQLRTLIERLDAHRLQIAVLGQFKRGKSSLINALIGQELLPSGVLPLTALPTFLAVGPRLQLQVRFEDGRWKAWPAGSAAELQARLAEYATESANPGNAKQVDRIDLHLPCGLLESGLVLIDTPGVGSTVLHNTEAAEAALPEGDAAILVLSPDPPITQAEAEYLDKVRANAAHLVVVLNKIDTTSAEDLATSVEFLRSVLAAKGLGETEIVPVSARQALEAIRTDDDAALFASGVITLRHSVAALGAERRTRVLDEAISLKAGAIVADLTFENDLMRAALATPLVRLEQQLAAFQMGATAFEAEQRASADRLAGDRRRLLEALDIEAQVLRVRVQEDLARRVGAALARGARERDAWLAVRAEVPELFEAEQAPFVRKQRTALETAVQDHQGRADALLESLRKTAADLLEIPYRAPQSHTAFITAHEAYWVDRPRESLGAAPAGVAERLLPGPLGRQLARQRVAGEIEVVTAANVEHLRWATRLNIEESLRQFARELDLSLTAGLTAIQQGLEQALAAKQRDAAAVERLTSERDRRRDRLALITEGVAQRGPETSP